MKKENVLVAVLICLALAGVVGYQYLGKKQILTPPDAGVKGPKVDGGADSTKIDWLDMEKGLAAAKEQNKHVFLYFHADWCTYCKKLKATTFKDKAVLNFLEQHFVSISVDTDKHRQLASTWRVTGLPTIWFLKPDGSKISNIPGYVTAKQMVKFLDYIHTKNYEQISFNEFIKTL